MALPVCPGCGGTIGWKHSFTFWNPWHFPCPHCAAPLEASRIQKYIALAVVPLGVLLAGASIVLERIGVWGTTGSLIYFAIIVPLLVAGALASWPHTRFTVKSRVPARK
jgi:hypothetical protein